MVYKKVRNNGTKGVYDSWKIKKNTKLKSYTPEFVLVRLNSPTLHCLFLPAFSLKLPCTAEAIIFVNVER